MEARTLSDRGPTRRPTLLVVPFYRNPHLAKPLLESLIGSAGELERHRACIRLYNDSPDDLELKEELERCVRSRGPLNLTLHENAENLGFVRTVNHALDEARRDRHDVLLLNSDAILFPGAIDEVVEVAYSDPMIGFVSPRSNNATLCTLPHSSQDLNLSPSEAFRRFQQLAGLLPRLTYAPTAVGFCLFIKWTILAEFGGFDTRYGRGYNEENDLIMRANRCGYRAALANHAFVWHAGEQSFGQTDEGRLAIDKRNTRLLLSRYPEYPRLLEGYVHSPEYVAEELLETLSPDSCGTITIGFDFSDFEPCHNGTFEAGKRLLASSAHSWESDIRLVVWMHKAAWDFHGISHYQRAIRIDPADMSQKAAAIVRVGQPFDRRALARLYLRAPVVAIFMLDTIASDCGYLRIEFDPLIWHFAVKWSDVIFTNSRFTSEQVCRRYALGARTRLVPTLHSVCPEEYASSPSEIADAPDHGQGRVLVIGNRYAHKAVAPTVDQLARVLPKGSIVALGCSGLDREGVEFIESGALSEARMEQIFSMVDAIVFPSHYEGFGFPVLHALARSKPIFVRRIPTYQEILERITIGSENVYWYESTEDLANSLARGIPSWHGPAAGGEKPGWDRSAGEVLRTIRMCIQQVRHPELAERLRWLTALYPQWSSMAGPEDYKADLAARALGNGVARLASKAFSCPPVYALTRLAWRAYRIARGAFRTISL